MIIEVNGNPGTKIIDICNYNVFQDVVKYCEENNKTPVGKRSIPASYGTGEIKSRGLEEQLTIAMAMIHQLEERLKLSKEREYTTLYIDSLTIRVRL